MNFAPSIPTMAETWLPVSTLNTYCCMKLTTHIRTSSDPIPYQGTRWKQYLLRRNTPKRCQVRVKCHFLYCIRYGAWGSTSQTITEGVLEAKDKSKVFCEVLPSTKPSCEHRAGKYLNPRQRAQYALNWLLPGVTESFTWWEQKISHSNSISIPTTVALNI